MSELTLTPELTLELQKGLRLAGLTFIEFRRLSRPEVLESLLPFLNNQAKLVPCRRFPVWQELTINDTVVDGGEYVKRLEAIGVLDLLGAFDHFRDQLDLDLKTPVTYELFCLRPLDLGLTESVSYEDLVRRATALGLHDGTATVNLVAELLLQDVIKRQTRNFRYRVCTQPLHSNFFGPVSVTFSLGNSFTAENLADTLLSREDIILIRHYAEAEGKVPVNEEVIFARTKRS